MNDLNLSGGISFNKGGCRFLFQRCFPQADLVNDANLSGGTYSKREGADSFVSEVFPLLRISRRSEWGKQF